MGYRSQVRCLIYGLPDKLNAMIVKHQLEGGKLFDNDWFRDNITRYKATRSYYDHEASIASVDPNTGKGQAIWREVEIEILDLYGDDWKWYPGYEDVRAWEAFMRGAHEWNCSYEFIRVGEEQNDIEREENVLDEGDRWLGTHTSIYCDAPAPQVTEGEE